MSKELEIYEAEMSILRSQVEKTQADLSKHQSHNKALNKRIRELEIKNKKLKAQLDKYKKSKSVKIATLLSWRIPRVLKRVVKGDLIQKNKRSSATSKPPKLPKDFRVAMVADEFTYNCFKYECIAFPLEPGGWLEVFQNNEMDFFFCESTWAGVDSLLRPWRGKVYASENFSSENRGALLGILQYCKENGIPTVFWNKEDPTHYEDRVHDFVDTALKFDHIFTTAAECVERYKNDYGHKSVHLLMFATQPKLFNPIETYERTDEVIFAGSWYRQHQERCDVMAGLLDSVLESPFSLKIYNRQSENDDPNHVFPAKYEPFINPRLPHVNLDQAYKGSKYGLNINTVVESRSMFARRVFELMSSNTLVITNCSKGIRQLFGDNVVYAEGDSFAIEDPDVKREFCLNEVLRHHTYKNRFEQILKVVGEPFVDSQKKVTLAYQIADEEEVRRALLHFRAVNWQNKHCLLLVERGVPSETLRSMVMSYNRNGVTVFALDYLEYEFQFPVPEGFAVLANEDMPADFIKRAMPHWQYLDADTGIVEGEQKYTFAEPEGNMPSMLMTAENFALDNPRIQKLYFI